MVSTTNPVKDLLDLSGLESELGLPKDFIKGILGSGDDWSFNIKTHALFESAVSHLIIQGLNQPRLEKLISRLSFGRQNGRLSFAENMGVIDPLHRKPLDEINNIRNRITHDIKNVDFNLVSYMKGKEGKESIDKFLRFFLEFGQVKPKKYPANKIKDLKNFVCENPRFMFAFCLNIILAFAYKRTNLLKEYQRVLSGKTFGKDLAEYFEHKNK
jgi:hypothetical protein